MANITSRYGSRYGRKLKNIAANIEKVYRGVKQKCPYCNKQGVKRLSMGVWHCRKCNKKFTGKAYSV